MRRYSAFYVDRLVNKLQKEVIMKLTISLAAGALVMAIASTAMAGTVLVKNMAPNKYGKLVVYYQADKAGETKAHTRPLSKQEGQRIKTDRLVPTRLVWVKHGKPVFTKEIPNLGQQQCAVSASSQKGAALRFNRHGKIANCSHKISV